MNLPRILPLSCAMMALLATDLTRGVMADDPTPEQRFEKLLEVARAEPSKADWKEVRHAFTGTKHYKPYFSDVPDKLKLTLPMIKRGETKEAEAELIRLIEQERFMRIRPMILLNSLYIKENQPEKGQKYRDCLDGIIRTMIFPDAATSFDKAIEVLYIDEEYFVASGADLVEQGVVEEKGHHYDVLTLKPDADKPERKLYFNIDLLWAANPMLKKEEADDPKSPAPAGTTKSCG